MQNDANAENIRKLYMYWEGKIYRYIVMLGTGRVGNIFKVGNIYLYLLMQA